MLTHQRRMRCDIFTSRKKMVVKVSTSRAQVVDHSLERKGLLVSSGIEVIVEIIEAEKCKS